MDTTINELQLPRVATHDHDATDAVRSAQYRMLEELPGVVFGIVTVAYIVGALIALM